MSLNQGADRIAWVDCCKGICIVLVVFGHVTGGLESAGILPGDSFFMQMRRWVYLFHMPAFFFLSGIFAGKAAGRSFWWVLQNKGRTIAYPYVLWTGIYLASQMLMARFSNNPPNVSKALLFLWEPYGYGLWFLYAIFLISLLFHLLLVARAGSIITLLVGAALCLGACFNVFGFWPILNTAMMNFAFYAGGAIFADRISVRLQGVPKAGAIAAGFVWLGLMTIIFVKPWAGRFPSELIAACFGIAGVIGISQGLASAALGRLFSVLGVFSLEIYLGHALFGTAARAIAVQSGIREPASNVLIGMLIGICASYFLGIFSKKLNCPYLFRWPRTPMGISRQTS